VGQTTYSNQEINEGSVSTVPVTITLARKSRAIEIINDSTADNLQYKFNSSEGYGILKPGEAVSMDFITNTILLDSPTNNSVSYRTRVLG